MKEGRKEGRKVGLSRVGERGALFFCWDLGVLGKPGAPSAAMTKGESQPGALLLPLQACRPGFLSAALFPMIL